MNKRFAIIIGLAVLVSMLVSVGCAPGAKEPVGPIQWTTQGKLDAYQAQVVDKGLVEDPNLPLNPYDGLAVKPDGSPFNFGSSELTMSDEIHINISGYMRSSIERASGTFFLQDAKFRVDEQVAFCEHIIATKRFDGLIIQAGDEDMLVPVCEKLEAAGITVVDWDTQLNSDKVTHVCYHDFLGPAGTRMMAAPLIEYAQEYKARTGEPLSVLEMWAIRDLQLLIDRHTALHDEVDKYPDLFIFYETPDNLVSEDTAAAHVRDAFTVHPEIMAIWDDGGGGGGPAAALRSLDRLFPVGDPNHVYLGMHDNSPQAYEGMQGGWVDNMTTHPLPDYGDYPPKAMLLAAVCKYTPLPKRLVLPTTLLTADNYETKYQHGVIATYQLLPPTQWDIWPVLDTTALGVPTPTLDLRKEYAGY
ncbi:sugar ABC transporter substrate-binding protein [Chloroflexota bacterium]